MLTEKPQLLDPLSTDLSLEQKISSENWGLVEYQEEKDYIPFPLEENQNNTLIELQNRCSLLSNADSQALTIFQRRLNQLKGLAVSL